MNNKLWYKIQRSYKMLKDDFLSYLIFILCYGR